MTDSIEKLVEKNNENFPVASFLIPKRYRKNILTFYQFARNSDDIADSEVFTSEEKLSQLEAIKLGLLGQGGNVSDLPDWAKDYYKLTQENPDLLQHGLDLLEAFILDVTKNRYATYEELLDYCNYSASPVGRYVLAVMGEDGASIKASDAICNVLQILNHIQDMKDDYVNLSRVYIPLEYLDEEHLADLAGDSETVEIRKSIDILLDNMDILLFEGGRLFKTIKSWRLRLELKLIYQLAFRLSIKLKSEDVLQDKVKLSTLEKLFCILRIFTTY